MNSVRQPCVAGYFYPADSKELAETVEKLLAQAKTKTISVPKAIISPHAGYIYSGPIAASIYSTVLPARKSIKRVVLLGPAHRYPFNGIAVTQIDNMATPLGNIPIDHTVIENLKILPNVHVIENAYDMEHSLEVQLPFLQKVIDDFTLVPCVIGNANPYDVANLLLHCWGGAETLIVISSDLSHYYDYETAQKLDKDTSEAILNLEPEQIHDNQACGRLPINGLLLAAAQLGLHAQVLDLRNSGDTAGNKDRVVGYGAYHFSHG